MSEKLRLFILDDEPSLKKSVPTYFIHQGFDVIFASSLGQAEKLLETTGDLDAFLVDKGAEYAPGEIGHKGGLTFIQDARDRYPYAVIDVWTGESYKPTAEVQNCGADYFFTKPVHDLNDLARTLKVYWTPELVQHAKI